MPIMPTTPGPNLHGDDLLLDDECRPSPGGPTMIWLEHEVRRLFLERDQARAEVARLRKHNERMREELIKRGYEANSALLDASTT